MLRWDLVWFNLFEVDWREFLSPSFMLGHSYHDLLPATKIHPNIMPQLGE